MNAMIFAAGLGTRLRPLTNSCPKAMVLLNGKPLLEHVIIKLKSVGIERIVVNVHHFADQITSFLANNDFGIDIRISNERECLLDTGGGLKYAKDLFIENEPILIYNVDVLSNVDISHLINIHIKSNSVATLLVRSDFSDRVFMSYQNKLTGWQNIKTGEKKIVNKDFYKSETIGFTGIHIVSYSIFEQIVEKGVFSIIDLYLRLAKTVNIMTVCDNNAVWMDLGTPDQLMLAEKQYNAE